MRTLLLAMLMIAAIGCSDDDDDDDDSTPTGPDTNTTGTVYGSALIYNQHLEPQDLHAGIVVRYVSTTGRAYTATTDAAGEWKLQLPFGVYYIDTIYHPTLQMFHTGWNPYSGSYSPIDWMGRGSRQYMAFTRFAPSTLDSVIAVKDLSVVPTEVSGLHYLKIDHTTQAGLSANVKANFTLTRSDGSVVATMDSWYTLPENKPRAENQVLYTGLSPNADMSGMKLTVTFSTAYLREQLYSTTEGRYGTMYDSAAPRNSTITYTW